MRYRAVADHPSDVEIQSVLQAMRSVANIEFGRLEACRNLIQLPWPARSTRGGSQEFLKAANKRSLRATQLQGSQAEAARLGAEFSKLLDDLPESCAVKFGEDTLTTAGGRAQLVVGLVNKHSGELVELDRRCASWWLRVLAPGSASRTLPPREITQWFCRDASRPAGEVDLQFGHPA